MSHFHNTSGFSHRHKKTLDAGNRTVTNGFYNPKISIDHGESTVVLDYAEGATNAQFKHGWKDPVDNSFTS